MEPERHNSFDICLFVLALVAVLVLYFWTGGTARAQIPNAAQGFRLPLTAFAKGEWGPDAPVASFAAQVAQESGWRPNAKSPVGALGLTQFMPTTASWISKLYPSELGDNDPGNPMWSLRALVKYDHWLYQRIKAANHCERMGFGLSSYNGGLGYVFKRQKASKQPGYCFDLTCDINPGITPANQRENAHYPRRILLELEPRYEKAGWGLGSC
jgi:soluble lytic murein transglycosylase-like protein